MISFPGKSHISFKESAILLALLAIILLLPLGVLQLFGKAWNEVFWQDRTDITMLEWTGAFFHVFLFLLLIEQYKATKRLMFVFMGCGFLGMGILNFFYALSSPVTETAMWIRAFSLLLGGVCFSFSIPARNKRSSDIPGVIVKFIIPTILLASLTLWVATSLDQILPELLTVKGKVSLFGKLFFIIPCGFFFFTALAWLHEYIKNKHRVDLLFVIVMLVYAQMILLLRGANTWGIIWWLLHVVIFIDVVIACVYMLVLSIYRSLVWKLLVSLGLAFSLTLLVASGIIQSYSEKKFLKNFQVNLHERYRRIVLESETNFKFALYTLNTMQRDAMSFSTGTDNFTAELHEYLKKKSMAWAPFAIEFGFYPEDGDIIVYYDNKRNREGGDLDSLRTLCSTALTSGKPVRNWTPFYYDNFRKKWVSTLVAPFQKEKIKGVFFVSLDISHIRNPDILRGPSGFSLPGGCVVFNRKNGDIICDLLPGTQPLEGGFDKKNQNRKPLLRKLIAAAIDVPPNGKIMVVKMRENKYYISTHQLQTVDWGVMNIVDVENFPGEKGVSRYFFIAVGMLTLLWGFILLLLLLHRQLSRPLGKLLNATEQLEHGNFDISVDINDATELGVISRAFNHMAFKLKNLYSDLASNVKERTDALEEVKKAESAKVTFFQNVSHELRTPMHGIISFARLGIKLKHDSNPEKISKYFKNINASAERLMKMIDSIMDLAKLESGHITFYFQKANFLLPFRQIEEELKAAFIEKGVELLIEIPQESITVGMDFEMIARVFRNLLGNALKMSDKDSKVEVKITLNDDRVQVLVQDEGPGIPENEINKIFDKFVQAGEGRQRGGTGLGLAVCREIINDHNGTICAENRLGPGACFTFEIPLKHIDESFRENK